MGFLKDYFLVFGIFGGSLLIIYLAHRYLIALPYERKREKALSEAAGRIGLLFTPHTNLFPEPVKSTSQLFKGHGSKRIQNLITGSLGGTLPVVLFDFIYSIQRETEVKQTVAAFRLRNADLPHFILKPASSSFRQKLDIRRMTTAISDRLSGFRKIQAPADRRGKKASHMLFSVHSPERIQECFGTLPVNLISNHPRWTVEGFGEWILIYQYDKRIKPGELKTRLQQWHHVVDGVSRAIHPSVSSTP